MPRPVQIRRPPPGEYPAEYGAYLERVESNDAWPALVRQEAQVDQLLGSLPEERALFRYAPGKWSVKGVLGHLCDNERIFSYRALRFARGDTTPLASFDENLYVPAGKFDARPMAEIVGEFRTIRAATLSLFSTFDDEALARVGVARGNRVSVRAQAWVIVGHVGHHLGVLRDRYGLGRSAT